MNECAIFWKINSSTVAKWGDYCLMNKDELIVVSGKA